MRVDLLRAKIDEDVNGAIQHWAARMQRWEFVHNDQRGLAAQAVQKLADLGTANPNVVLAVCGEAELRAIVMSLALHQLEDLFGAVPSDRTLERLDFAALRPVLLAIQRKEQDTQPPLAAPPAAKQDRKTK